MTFITFIKAVTKLLKYPMASRLVHTHVPGLCLSFSKQLYDIDIDDFYPEETTLMMVHVDISAFDKLSTSTKLTSAKWTLAPSNQPSYLICKQSLELATRVLTMH